jgi:hypothetical protein
MARAIDWAMEEPRMKVSIQGHHFDTDKATHHWQIILVPEQRFEDTVLGPAKTAEVYRSSGGTFYVYAESDRASVFQWRIITASEILSTYDAYLNDEQKTEIAEAGGIKWE